MSEDKKNDEAISKWSLANWKTKIFWKDGTGSIGVAVLFALFIRWALFEAYVIPTGSMLPSLLIHDHIFVNKFNYGLRVPFSEKWLVKFSEPKRGEVIVFKYPVDMTTFFIKRVVGLPGDKIYYEAGTLYINDKEAIKTPPGDNKDFDWLRDEDFQDGGTVSDAKDNYSHFLENLGEGTKPHNVLLRKGESFESFGPVIVPEGQLFMMGDNRDRSADSRRWGFMPKENILGRASVVWLSCEKTLPVLSFLCNPLTIRWTRFFHSVE